MAFMAAAIPYIMAATAVIGAVAAIKQGQAAKAAADFNAQVATQNAELARQEAAAAERNQQRETYMRLGAIHAAQGHAGGDAAQGSVLDVLGDVAAQSELERQQVVYQGELKARGFTNTALLDKYSGQTAETTGYLKAGSELLGGASSAYSTTTKLKRG
jgi:hypothetical protein